MGVLPQASIKPMRTYKSPLKGCTIYATAEHPLRQADTVVGVVHLVQGNVVIFKDGNDTDKLIWKFKDGQINSFFKFGA